MKKSMIIVALLLVATQAFASSYWVVLKDGTKYEALAKWKIVDGKAVITLKNGHVLQLDPNTIDVAKSEETTRLGGAALLGVEQLPTSVGKTSSLGSQIKLRKLPSQQQQPAAVTTTEVAPAPATSAGGLIGQDAINNFERAYENVGIFEHTLKSAGPHTIRADLTTDSEEKVFNALSATAFLIVRNAGLPNVQVDAVDLYMKTTTGGASGRFHMTRDDAKLLDSKQLTREDYFVRRVLF